MPDPVIETAAIRWPGIALLGDAARARSGDPLEQTSGGWRMRRARLRKPPTLDESTRPGPVDS